jgi:hypothetical protein
MAEILVTEIRARRLSAAGDCFCACRDHQAHASDAPGLPRLFHLFCALFFSGVFFFAISMAFPVFGARRRPVNRRYFFSGISGTPRCLHRTGPARLGSPAI